MSCLSRLGNKRKLVNKILPFFLPHETYIEPFFGAGALFFAKPLAKQSFLNDLDSDVYNLWDILAKDKQGLIEWVELMPVSEQLFKEWGKGKQETDPILKAVRFLMLSNFSYMGMSGTLQIVQGRDSKRELLKAIKKTLLNQKGVLISNKDFRKAIKDINFREETDRKKCFMYLDPPYLGTTDNYSHSFTEQDSADLFQVAVDSRIPFAMSEFNHPFILEQAAHHNLTVNILGERQTMKSRQTEILITSYKPSQTLF